jgi:hypothetical protein
LNAALQLLAPRHAHHFSAEAFDPVRVVLNRALYFHHKLLHRTCCGPDTRRYAVPSNDIPLSADDIPSP